MLGQVTSVFKKQNLAETLPIRRAENVGLTCVSQKSKGEALPNILKSDKVEKLAKLDVDDKYKLGEKLSERISEKNKLIAEIRKTRERIEKAAANTDRKRKRKSEPPIKIASVKYRDREIRIDDLESIRNIEIKDPCAVVADTSTKLAIASDSSSSAFVASDSSSIGTSVLRLRNNLDRQFKASSVLEGPSPNQTTVNSSLVQEEKPLRTSPLGATEESLVKLIEWTSIYRFQPRELEADCDLIIHLTTVLAQTIEYLVATRNPQSITLEAEFTLPVVFRSHYISRPVVREFLNHAVNFKGLLPDQLEVVLRFDSDEEFVPFKASTCTHLSL
jgi:hypothetical protein